jgi:hypothetical protein
VRGAPAELAAREREGRVKPKSETERGMRERDVLVSPPPPPTPKINSARPACSGRAHVLLHFWGWGVGGGRGM